MNNSTKKTLFDGTEWTVEMLNQIWAEVDKVGKRLGLDYYEPQIEIITAEQMLDAYSSHALPQMYDHWSFGKSFVRNENAYKSGKTGLAFEVVINTNPSIAYLMETNTATVQTLVMAHAICGHATFFKNNYLFKEWTDADTILDYLNFAKKYIKECEEKYGQDEVEELLDACHSLQRFGVDKYKKPRLTKEMERLRGKERDDHIDKTFNDLWRTTPRGGPVEKLGTGRIEHKKPQDKEVVYNEENILYFIEKNSPILEEWQREIIRINRKIAQYFYPQMQTSLMNEGFACLIHHTVMTELHEQGSLTDGAYLEFLSNHAGVIMQPDWNSKYYSGINVYALGYAMMIDIKRICTNPTEEDQKWFGHLGICGSNWLDTIKQIVANYRDESFVLQFLSPKVIRDLGLFNIRLDSKGCPDFAEVVAVQDDEDILAVREALSAQYDLSRSVPQIEVHSVDWQGDRVIELHHITKNNQLLKYEEAKKTLRAVEQLWGFDVRLKYYDISGERLDDV